MTMKKVTPKEVAQYLVQGFCEDKEVHEQMEEAGYRDCSNLLTSDSPNGFMTIRLENEQLFNVIISEVQKN